MRPRIDKDVYLTDEGLAKAILDDVIDPQTLKNPSGVGFRILDPGAGSGVFGKVCRDRFYNASIYGVDIRDLENPGWYDRWYGNTDFLEWQDDPFDLIIGNPPFKLAEKFIRKSVTLLSQAYGEVAFLLPVDFQHGARRGRGLFKEYNPTKVTSLLQRPNFTGPNGESLGTANTDNYIVMNWNYYYFQYNYTVHRWLDWKK